MRLIWLNVSFVCMPCTLHFKPQVGFGCFPLEGPAKLVLEELIIKIKHKNQHFLISNPRRTRKKEAKCTKTFYGGTVRHVFVL